MKSEIPQTALPSKLAEPNAITTTYTTNVLYPKVGPLTVNNYLRKISRVLRDYAFAMSVAENIADYHRLFRKPVEAIRDASPWLRDDIKFDRLARDRDDPQIFLAELVEFSDPLVTPHTGAHDTVTRVMAMRNEAPEAETGDESASGGSGGNRVFDIPLRIPNRPVLVLNGNAGAAGEGVAALSDIAKPQLKLLEGRLAAQKLSPSRLFMASDKLLDELAGGEVDLSDETTKEQVERQERAYRLGNIMHTLSLNNTVTQDFFGSGVLRTEGELLDPALLDVNDLVDAIGDRIKPDIAVPDIRFQHVGKLVDEAADYLDTLGLADTQFMRRYRKSGNFRNRVKRYVIGKLDGMNPLDGHQLPLPDGIAPGGAREWAFQRVERLDLHIGTPEFRGPYSADSVAPNSELELSEAFTEGQFEISERISGQARSRASERMTFSSSEFRSALDSMTEEGITNENAFSEDSTLLSTLHARRRETIDRTMSRISSENESRASSGSRSVNSSSRRYLTSGKDAVHATTELKFQVTAPVTAKVQLEDVNLVWCPRVDVPFLELARNIRRFEETAREEYLQQNQIVDPVRPVEEYEYGEFKRELEIRGTKKSQGKNFDFRIPGEYLDGWELADSRCDVGFRNGGWDDYNWNERGNWDDLEDHDEDFIWLRKDGDRVKGRAILRTRDPELGNKGFFTFKFGLRKKTARYEAELRNWRAENREVALERDAVESRARQYARLRRDELVQKFEAGTDLREEVFATLMRQVFFGQAQNRYSYYQEIIRSCIKWSAAQLHLEPNMDEDLPYPQLSRSHFLNATGARFVLPIQRSSEDAFFQSMSDNASFYYQQAAEEVQRFTNGYRERIKTMESDSPEALELDNYTREMVLGHHLEAVMSNHPFATEG